MELTKKDLTTAELLELVRRGDEARRLARVKAVVPNGPCEVTFVLPPPGTLDRKLAAARAGREKRMSELAEKLVAKTPAQAQEFLGEYQRELAEIEDAVKTAENEAYADYIVDIRDKTVSTEGKPRLRLSFISECVLMAGTENLSMDTIIEFSREIVLLLLRPDDIRNWFISRITNVGLYNALRKEAALKNSEPSRTGAPVESLPAANAPTGDSSNSTQSEGHSSTSTGTTPGESTTNSGDRS